jgi:lipoprotein-anchoring transpeptidase ErfK/SrfK
VADALVALSDTTADAAATSARLDARRVYATIYRCDDSTNDEMIRAFDGCARLNQAVLFSNGAPDELVLRHKVQAGENVWSLSKGPWKQRGASVPAGFVLHVNGIADARRIRAGQSLRVPLEPMRILVKKSRFELAVLLGGVPVERFTVAIGAGSSTPAGVFKVKDRIKEPDWYLHGRRIPYGDPQNIIGTRWIGLTGAAAVDGIGIHGTADDASVGKAVSLGCVRMHNADVEKVFEWLDSGVDVEIRD